MRKKKKIPESITNLFVNHPHAIGETYFEHLRFAMMSGIRLTLGGLACIIHSIFPFLFIDIASKTVENLSKDFEHRRNSK